MSVNNSLNILRKGHPILDQKASPVLDKDMGMIATLAPQITELMLKLNAAGIAANQIGLPLRFFVYQVITERSDNLITVPPTIVINPKIELSSNEEIADWEGCLSLPGMTGFVPRKKNLTFSFINIHGKKIIVEAQGFHARVIQHEIDHLDGITYLSRINNFNCFGFKEELAIYKK